MTNIREYVRERNWIVTLILLVIGLALLLGSTYFEESSRNYILMTNLGAAFIVTAIAFLILSYAVKGIETLFGGAINELVSKLDVLPEAKKCGIVRIFESRRRDPNFKKELIKQFENASKEGEVLLMSISLRNFFGPIPDNEYLTAIYAMLRKNIKFKILLLDPTSEAAIHRALIEEREMVKAKGYINSTLFTEIKSVAERLNNPSLWIAANDLRERIKEQIDVRFSPYDPTTYLIITEWFTFVEQYHRGGEKEISETLEKEGIPLIDCFGGFVPVLMVENSAFFARLMKSHFMNIWDSDDVKKRDLKKNDYYQKILDFEEEKRKN